jgi:hypothetical protein
LVVGFAVGGWFLGWYQLGITKTPDGTLHVETNVNTKKVADDSTEAWNKTSAFVGEHLEKTVPDAKATAPSPTPPPTPVKTPGPQDPAPTAKVSVFGIDLTPSEKK